jgi:hypothetical protein
MNEEVEVDAKLLEEASELTGEQNHRKIVEDALQEMIQRRRKLKGLEDLAGKIQFYEGYDYKVLRKTRYDDP